MKYNKIRKMDIANGPVVRVSVFLQGCSFHCKNCFNPETWDFDNGLEFDDKVIDEIIELCGKKHIQGLSILGGEPMHPKNIKGTIKLAKKFKEVYPDKDLWSWSGFLFDQIIDKEIFDYLDVLVDGQYVDELRNPNLKWRGSSNQRVIDIKKTVTSNNIIFYKDEEY